MANNLKGKVWSIDSVAGVGGGEINTDPVVLHSIIIRFTTAGAGSCIISSSLSTANRIIDATSTATSTANAFGLTQIFTMGDQTFPPMIKIVSVNVDTIMFITGLQR